MKHISTKLILLTIALTTGLLTATALFAFGVLKKESRAYTFQSQLLQTELIAENLNGQLAKIRQIAAQLLEQKLDPEHPLIQVQAAYESAKRVSPNLLGLGLQLKNGTPTWIEFPENNFKHPAGTELITTPNLTVNNALTAEASAYLPVPNALIALHLDLSLAAKACTGLPAAFFNHEQKVVFYCSSEGREIFAQAQSLLSEIEKTKIGSGTMERAIGEEKYLWTYSRVADYGYAVSVTPASQAYGPAYSLVSQVILMILMAIGIAVAASIWMARKLTAPLEEVTRATQKIAAGEFKTLIAVHTKDETATLARAVESMGAKIEGLLESEVEKAKLDAQLEVAGEVQRVLIPPSEVISGTSHISSYYRPADQCGGDWWGFIPGPGKLALLIGDVSGHGYASALLVATTRGFLSMLDERVVKEGSLNMSPAEILQSLNRVVFDATRAELNMTAMCLILDQASGQFELASAGHNSAYLTRKADASVETLRARGMRLGETREMESLPEITEGNLGLGDKIIFYTDGVQDLGPSENPLGRKGFKDFIAAQALATASETVAQFESQIYPLHAGRPLPDDLTFVVLEGSA